MWKLGPVSGNITGSPKTLSMAHDPAALAIADQPKNSPPGFPESQIRKQAVPLS